VSLLILSLSIPLFVPPNEVRGPSALACLGKTLWEAVTPNLKARGLLVRRRPERSEECLALLDRTSRYGRMHFQCDI